MSAPDAAVEAAAKALAWRCHNHFETADDCWNLRTGPAKEEWRADARTALEAAAPHIRAQTADVIADGMDAWAGSSERAYVRGFAEAAWGKVHDAE